jgi:hypothetical protein
MSARKRTRICEEVVDSRPIQLNRDFIEEPAGGRELRSLAGKKKHSRAEDVGGVIAPKRATLEPLDLLPRVLYQCVFFLNNEKSRYVSSGLYPARNYQIFLEFGSPRITAITLSEQHVKTLADHLPKLCEAMCRGECYTCKDDVFRLQCTGNNSVARMYQDLRFVTFKIDDFRYLMNILHIVQVQQNKYILLRNDVIAYAIAALGSTESFEPSPIAINVIPYDQLFDELKTPLL